MIAKEDIERVSGESRDERRSQTREMINGHERTLEETRMEETWRGRWDGKVRVELLVRGRSRKRGVSGKRITYRKR